MNIHLSARIAGLLQKCKSILVISSVCLLFASCSEEKLFVSDFDNNTLNQPPATNQKVGTLTNEGNVLIANSPVAVAGKWANTSRPGANDPVSGYTCHNSKFIGDGEYRFSATLFIPANTGLVTIDFEPDVPPGGSFLHIDFMQNNTVRLQDNDIIPGMRFPKDSLFIAQVTLKISSTGATAHIALGGAGTTGTFDFTLPGNLLSQARRFSQTKLFIGFPWTGNFLATNIVTAHVK